MLLLDVDGAHVHFAFEAEEGSGRRQGDTVRSGAGFGDNLLLAHPLCKQDLTEAVVELVRAHVVEVFALEVDLRATQMLREPFREVQHRRAAHVVAEQRLVFLDEGRVLSSFGIGCGDLGHGRHELGRQVRTAVFAEVAVGGLGAVLGHVVLSCGPSGHEKAAPNRAAWLRLTRPWNSALRRPTSDE